MYSFDNSRDSMDHFEQLVSEFIAFKKSVGETPVLPYGPNLAATQDQPELYIMRNHGKSGCGCEKDRESFENLSPIDVPELHPNREEKAVDRHVPRQEAPQLRYYTGKELEGADEILEMDSDLALLWALTGEINQKLYPMIIETLNEYEYEGSPIFGGAMDREFIAQAVDRVLEKAAKAIEEVEEIGYDNERCDWHRHRLLRATVEIGIIIELGACRRPRYRRVMRHCDKLF